MVIREKISKEKLREIIGDNAMAKMAVDVERKVLAIGCDFHVFCAEELLRDGSRRKNLWGANVYPDGTFDFTAVFNIRPIDGNRSVEIHNEDIRGDVESVMKTLLPL